MLEEILHVPLIVKLPTTPTRTLPAEVRGAGPGRTIETPVQSVDLWPTLAELCGIEPPRVPQDGRSLVPLIAGRTLDPVPLFASEGLFTQASVRLGDWRLSRYLMRGGDPASRMTFFGLDDPWLVEHLPEIAGRSLTRGRMAAIEARLGGREALEDLLATRRPDSELRLYDLRADPRERVNLFEARPEKAAELNELLLQAYLGALEGRLLDPAAERIELGDRERRALEAVGYLEDH